MSPHRRRAERLRDDALLLFVLTLLFITWSLWRSERDSCLRTDATRATQVRIIAETGIDAGAVTPRRLDCGGLYPDVQ